MDEGVSILTHGLGACRHATPSAYCLKACARGAGCGPLASYKVARGGPGAEAFREVSVCRDHGAGTSVWSTSHRSGEGGRASPLHVRTAFSFALDRAWAGC